MLRGQILLEKSSHRFKIARSLSENRNRNEKVGWQTKFIPNVRRIVGLCKGNAAGLRNWTFHPKERPKGEAHGWAESTFGANWDATTAFAVDFSIVGQTPRHIQIDLFLV